MRKARGGSEIREATVAFMDGTVWSLGTKTDRATLQALLTPGGGEAVDREKVAHEPSLPLWDMVLERGMVLEISRGDRQARARLVLGPAPATVKRDGPSPEVPDHPGVLINNRVNLDFHKPQFFPDPATPDHIAPLQVDLELYEKSAPNSSLLDKLRNERVKGTHPGAK